MALLVKFLPFMKHSDRRIQYWQFHNYLCLGDPKSQGINNHGIGLSFSRTIPASALYASVNWVIMCSCNGLSPVRRQAITWTNAGSLSIGLLGTNFCEIWIGILPFLFKKIHLKMSSAKIAAILSGGGGGGGGFGGWVWVGGGGGRGGVGGGGDLLAPVRFGWNFR